MQSRRRFPKEGKVLATTKGSEKVVSVDIFRERVTLKAEDATTRIVPLADLKREVEALAPLPAAEPAPAPEQPEPSPSAPSAPPSPTPGEHRRGRRGGRRRRHGR